MLRKMQPHTAPQQRRSQHVSAGTVLALAAAAFLTGCADEDPAVNYYCLEDDGDIVPNEHCDTDYSGGGFYYIATTSGNYSGGQKLPSSKAIKIIRATDTAGRQSFGLPANGPIGQPGGFGGTTNPNGG